MSADVQRVASANGEHAGADAGAPAPLFAEGDVVGGRYVLSRVLGRGAAGTVWEHRLLTSRVAVKFLDTAATLDETAAEILAQRFRFEAQLCARLGTITKHIVTAHDAGMYRGIPYLVMELVEGETLDARLTRTPLTPEEAADMLDQLAEPVDGAHGLGIAHRDIKPGNVMIAAARDGVLYKLGDFGTAKAFGEGLVGLAPPKQTSENTLVGSPAYMSPEYISGQPVVSGTIDVWALAVTTFEAITGRLPFDGEVWTQLADAIVRGEFPMPSTLSPAIPPSLDEVFVRAFSAEPNDRYLHARHFARAFRHALTQKKASVEIAPVTPEPMRAAAVTPLASLPAETDTFDAIEVPRDKAVGRWGMGAIALAVVAVIGGAFLLARSSSSDGTERVANAAVPAPPPAPSPPPVTAEAKPETTSAPVDDKPEVAPTTTAEPSASARSSSRARATKRAPAPSSGPPAAKGPAAATTPTSRPRSPLDPSEVH